MVPASIPCVKLASAPIPASWVREGNPVARSAILSHSADGAAMTLEWDCTAGKFDWIYDIEETIYITEGCAFIGTEKSPMRKYQPGDVLTLSSGTVAHWKVDNYVRKIAFLRLPQPRFVTLGVLAIRKMRQLISRPAETNPLRQA
ncbi:MAG: DUF861 domain-containing protein [Alphaproteobacteria bacterium]|nr:DUF861 domain-containing protein [Alphaproteobacteria bacterium]